MMSRFPKITETFILYEMLELEKLGLAIEVFPLLKQKGEQVVHAEAQPLIDKAHYSALFSPETLAAQWYWLRKRPAAYLRAWWSAIRGNLQSPKFLARAVLVVMPKAALFARQMQQLGVEHVHAHWATHPALGAYLIHQLSGIPYSFTAHAHDIYVERPMLDQKIADASFVVTISEYNRRLLQRLYGTLADDKVVVVHCGADLSVFTPRPEPPANQPFTIVCVGALQEKKGQRYLVQAVATLKQAGVTARCLLIGDGDDRTPLAELAGSLGISEQIIFLGRQPREKVSEALAGAHVACLPSVTTASGRQEGIPVALMEAMATALPVVSTTISGIPELVADGETGLLVPERNPEALAQALQRLASDPQMRQQMGQAGRAKVLQEFDLNQNATLLYRLLIQPWSSVTRIQPSALLDSVAALTDYQS